MDWTQLNCTFLGTSCHPIDSSVYNKVSLCSTSIYEPPVTWSWPLKYVIQNVLLQKESKLYCNSNCFGTVEELSDTVLEIIQINTDDAFVDNLRQFISISNRSESLSINNSNMYR